MKIRNGFVSNSSSSSFVLIGCRLTDTIKSNIISKAPEGIDPDDFTEIAEALDIGYVYTEEKDGDLIGDILAYSEEDFYETNEYDIDQLINQDLLSKLSKYGVDKKDIKLYTGFHPT
jgi:hypothetical protein